MKDLLQALLLATKNGDFEIAEGSFEGIARNASIKVYPLHSEIARIMKEWGYGESKSRVYRKALEEAFVREAAKRERNEI